MRIGDIVSRKGDIVRGNLTLAKHRRKPIELPIFIAEGKEKGPVAFLSAGIHGNEVNGVVTLNRFMEKLKPKKLSGTLVIIPVVNVSGFQERIRYVTYDHKDLNRVFNIEGRTASYKMAATFLQEVCSQCDFALDLHDAGEQNVLLPHSRVHIKERDGCTKELGAQFGTEVIIERDGWPGMMAVECYRTYKIPVLTVEIGGGMRIWEEFIPQGIRGIQNILIAHQMLPGKVVLPKHQFFLSKRAGYLAPLDGLLTLYKNLGDTVSEGELLGEIVDPLTWEKDEINAYECGVVFSIRQQAKIDRGDTAISVMHFATDEIHKRKPAEPDHTHMIVNSADTLGLNHHLVRGDIFEKALSLEPTQE